MKALKTLGVVALFMLSACAVSTREGSMVTRQSDVNTHATPAATPALSHVSQNQVHFVAYGQVLSYWALHLK